MTLPKFNPALLKKRPDFVPDAPTVQMLWEEMGSSTEEAFVEYTGIVGNEEHPMDEDGNGVYPIMPPNITLLSSDELGHLYGQFVAMATYLDEQATKNEMEAVEAETFLDHLKAEELLTKTGTVAAKQAKATTAEHIIRAERASLVCMARAKLLRSRVRGYERCGSALSREMTRRNPNSYMPPTLALCAKGGTWNQNRKDLLLGFPAEPEPTG